MTYVLIAVVVGMIAFNVGWIHVHQVIAKECERLGGFYVGKKVFKCTEVEMLPGGQVPPFVPRNPPPAP